jgi:hypothetical protein
LSPQHQSPLAGSQLSVRKQARTKQPSMRLTEMPDVSEKNAVGRFVEGSPSASSSERRNEAGLATQSPLALKDLLEPTCLKTLYVGGLVPLLFACLGSSNALAPYIEQSQWLVGRMAPVWPALPPQYELVSRTLGAGQAASFGFMCAALWIWPVIILVDMARKHARLRSAILPVAPAEIGAFIVLIPAGFFFLLLDTTTTTSPARFYVDRLGFFYFRQWFLFLGTAVVLATFVYLLGRIISSVAFEGAN